MTWTAPDLDDDSRRAYVRSLVGDTDPTDPQISDELIAPFVLNNPKDDLAGWRVALFLVGKYAREVATQIGPLKESAQERVTNYTILANELYRAGMGLPPAGVIGGTNDPGLRMAGGRAIDNGINVASFFTRDQPA